jgi:hypothetical protein
VAYSTASKASNRNAKLTEGGQEKMVTFAGGRQLSRLISAKKSREDLFVAGKRFDPR